MILRDNLAVLRSVNIVLRSGISIVGAGNLVRICAVRLNLQSDTVSKADFIVANSASSSSSRASLRPSCIEFATIIRHCSLNYEAGVLHIRLSLGIPSGLALVQVNRDGHGGEDADDDDDHEQFDEGEALFALGTAVECVTYALHNEPFFPIGRTYRGTVQLRMVHSDSSLRYFPLWGWLAHITNNSQRSRIDIVCSTRCSAPIAPMMFHPPFSSQPRIKLFQYDCITPLHTITTVRFRNMR
jgi:hypothetical protein